MQARYKRRNEQLLKAAQARDEWGRAPTLEELAAPLGLTRERVRQILEKLGHHKPHHGARKASCPTCGKTFRLDGGRKHCSRACSYAKRTVHLCSWCGKPIVRRESINERGRQEGWDQNPYRAKPQSNWFCNYSCQGSYFGNRHGTGNPNHPLQLKARRTDQEMKALQDAYVAANGAKPDGRWWQEQGYSESSWRTRRQKGIL